MLVVRDWRKRRWAVLQQEKRSGDGCLVMVVQHYEYMVPSMLYVFYHNKKKSGEKRKNKGKCDSSQRRETDYREKTSRNWLAYM